MSTISPHRSVVSPSENGQPLLCNGDRMKQPEFHRRYETYPKDVKFELIGGIVYMASPLRLPHGRVSNSMLSLALALYHTSATPGVEVADERHLILGEESEPQPDLLLRILTEYGGRSGVTEDEYCQGPPELLAEIAHSSRAIDMNQKREDYEQAGVLEYQVLCVEERELHWFHFPSGRPIRPDRRGRRAFPRLPRPVDRRAGPALSATAQGSSRPCNRDCPPWPMRRSSSGWKKPASRRLVTRRRLSPISASRPAPAVLKGRGRSVALPRRLRAPSESGAAPTGFLGVRPCERTPPSCDRSRVSASGKCWPWRSRWRRKTPAFMPTSRRD